MKDDHGIPVGEKPQRIVYLDALRCVSMFAVMVIHLAATGYKEALPGSYEWFICLIYNSITRFAVPVFVMISGAMYLDPEREVTMAHILRKLGKLLVVFCFWSLVYALAESPEEYTLFSAGYFQSVIEKTIEGHYHMWYVYMIAGLYLATPFLRPMAADKNLLRTFILLAFLVNHGIRLLCEIPGLGEIVQSVESKADIGIFSGYAGYYCLGYYLHSTAFSKKEIRKFAAFSAALISVVLIIGLLPDRPDILSSDRQPHIFVYSAGVFLIFKSRADRLEKSSFVKTIVGKVAPCSLGMYLIHPMFNFILRKAGLHALTFDPFLCIPMCSVLVCSLSYAVISLMKRIPVVKRFV